MHNRGSVAVPLTDRNKITILFAEGIAKGMEDSYWFCVDSGDVKESDAVHRWSVKQDNLMKTENLTPREYIAKYGRGYL